jgi:hypothetical protein
MEQLGFDSQVGFGEEASYGTLQTPDRFFEFTTEGMSNDVARMESRAIRKQSFQPRFKVGQRAISGDFACELPTVGFGLFLKHLLGGVVTDQPDDVGAPTVFEHTFTPDSIAGLGLTAQMVRGTVPFTYTGCKVSQLAIASRVGEIATATVSLVGQNEDLVEPAAVAAYPTDLDLFTFLDGTLTLDAAELEITSVNATVANALKSDRWKHGSNVTREPLRNGFRDFTGDFEVNFEDLDLYNLYRAGTLGQLVLTFEGAEIEGGFSSRLQITSQVRIDGTTPTIGSPEEIMTTVPFKAIPDGGNDDVALTVTYRSTDTTP